MNLGTLTVKIGADTVQFDTAAARTKTQLSDLAGVAKAGGLAFAAIGAAAVTAAAAIGGAFVKASFDAVDAQNDLATKLNTTSASLATLNRAGGLAGVEMSQISAASRMLALNLSKAAADGAGPASEALARLHLSASELQALPLDQRIAAINGAITQFIPAAQQASVAADLFGAKNALAMQTLDPATIAQAAHEAEVLGLHLSEIDVQKVAQAADAFDVFGMALDGIGQQMAVQVAPLITQISNDFFKAAESAGGFGNVAESVFQDVINAAAFVMDAGDGVARVFELTAKGIVIAFQTVVTTVGGAITTLVTTADDALQAIGIDTLADKAEGVRDKFAQHMGTLKIAAEDFNETLERPLSGERFKQYVADAQSAAQEAGAAMAAAGAPAAAGIDGPSKADTEAAKKAAEAEQKEFDARLERLQSQYVTVQELDRQHQQAMLDVRRGFEEGEITTVAEHNALMEQLAADHAAKVSDIENSEAEARARFEAQKLAERRQAWQGFFGNLSTLMNSESRKMFEIGKIAATANAVIAGYESAVHSYNAGSKIGGPAVGAAFAAASLAATGAQISAIQSQSFGGGGRGGSSGAASATQAVNAASTPVNPNAGAAGNTTTYQIAGLNKDELFTGGQIRALITRMNEERRDGSRLEFT